MASYRDPLSIRTFLMRTIREGFVLYSICRQLEGCSNPNAHYLVPIQLTKAHFEKTYSCERGGDELRMLLFNHHGVRKALALHRRRPEDVDLGQIRIIDMDGGYGWYGWLKPGVGYAARINSEKAIKKAEALLEAA